MHGDVLYIHASSGNPKWKSSIKSRKFVGVVSTEQLLGFLNSQHLPEIARIFSSTALGIFFVGLHSFAVRIRVRSKFSSHLLKFLWRPRHIRSDSIKSWLQYSFFTPEMFKFSGTHHMDIEVRVQAHFLERLKEYGSRVPKDDESGPWSVALSTWLFKSAQKKNETHTESVVLWCVQLILSTQ